MSEKTRKAYTPFNKELRERFLEVLGETGTLIAACDAVGTLRQTVQAARKSEPEFDEAYEAALDRYRKKITDEIHRRGIEGVEEPVYQGGKLVGTKQVYSDGLLLAMAKARVPEYKEKAPEVIVNNQTLTVNVSLEALPQDARAALRQAAEALRAAQPVLDVPSDDEPE